MNWIEFYSDISNIEDYYETFDIKNPTRGFVNREISLLDKILSRFKKEGSKIL